LKYLHLDSEQHTAITTTYKTDAHYHGIFNESAADQRSAVSLIGKQGLDVRNLADLGNRWSVRWSSKLGKGDRQRVLLQWYGYNALVVTFDFRNFNI